jgi:hypothetical protein
MEKSVKEGQAATASSVGRTLLSAAFDVGLNSSDPGKLPHERGRSRLHESSSAYHPPRIMVVASLLNLK